jgi:ribosomal protein S18 acetylase RimI-like enzyme
MRILAMIRRVKIEDISAIQAIIQQNLSDFLVHTDGLEKFNDFALQRMVLNPDIHYWVYEKQRKVIGCIGYRVPAHLVHFFVDQSYQGQGIGKQLWIYAFEHLKRKYPQQEHFKMSVNSSPAAVVVYKKLGFETVSALCESGGIRYVKMILDVSLTDKNSIDED